MSASIPNTPAVLTIAILLLVTGAARGQNEFGFGLGTRPRTMQKLPPRAEGPAHDSVPPSERAVREALAKPIAADLVEQPLRGALEFFADRLALPVRLDPVAAAQDGVDPETLVTLEAERISGRAALDAVLRQLDPPLDWTEQDGIVWVTSSPAATTRMPRRVYDVSDLVLVRGDDGEWTADFPSLISALQECLPGPWETMDGIGGVITRFEATGVDVLSIRASRAQHEAIETLLATLRAIRKSPETLVAPTDPGELELRQALAQRQALEFNGTPLSDVAASVSKGLGVPVVLDWASINRLQLGPDEPVYLPPSEVPVGTALAMALRPSGLAWLVGDGLVWITSVGDSATRLVTRVYNVRDLVVSKDLQGADQRDFGSLTALLHDQAGGPWLDTHGAGGALRSLRASGLDVLVVRQTPRCHEEIEQLLGDMRRLRRTAE